MRNTTLTTLTTCSQQHRACERQGATLVEFAMVVPLVFMLGFGFVEFGRYSLARHALEESARVGCRAAIVKNATVGNIEATVKKTLTPFGIKGHQVTVSNLSVNQGDMVTVEISVSYDKVKWMPMPEFLTLKTISAACSLPKEADQN